MDDFKESTQIKYERYHISIGTNYHSYLVAYYPGILNALPSCTAEGVRWRIWPPLLSPVLFVLLFTTTADAFV